MAVELRYGSGIAARFPASGTHAVELVWKQYADMLFAPLFHEVYPHNKFIISYPSPQEPTLFMLLVAKAYPLFRTQFLAAIDRMKAANKRKQA